MGDIGQWCAICRGGKDKDGKESHKRKLAVVSVLSSSASTEENVMCLLHYAVGYLNDAKAKVKGMSIPSRILRNNSTQTHTHSNRYFRASKAIAVRE